MVTFRPTFAYVFLPTPHGSDFGLGKVTII